MVLRAPSMGKGLTSVTVVAWSTLNASGRKLACWALGSALPKMRCANQTRGNTGKRNDRSCFDLCRYKAGSGRLSSDCRKCAWNRNSHLSLSKCLWRRTIAQEPVYWHTFNFFNQLRQEKCAECIRGRKRESGFHSRFRCHEGHRAGHDIHTCGRAYSQRRIRHFNQRCCDGPAVGNGLGVRAQLIMRDNTG